MIARLLTGLFGASGGLAGAQFPAFYQQYLQRLGGRRDQALADLEVLRADAAELGYSLKAYIAELGSLDSEAAQQTAARELHRVDQADHLRDAYQAMAAAGPLERPLVFAEYFDSAIAQNTLAAFQPALPLSPEAFVYFACGLLLGLAFFRLSRQSTGAALSRLKRTRKDEPISPPVGRSGHG